MKKSIGEYIAEKRKEKNLTQKELADKLFITESAVSKWERGKSYPDLSLVTKICEILNISEHEFLTASEDTETKNNETLAKKYLRLLSKLRVFQIVLYLLPIIICFICNIAIQHKLSWFWIVLFSEMIAASLTLLPLCINKNKLLKAVFACLISIILLLITCAVYTSNLSFLPITLVSIALGFSLIFLPFILDALNVKENKTIIYFIVESILLLLFFLVICLVTKGDWYFNIALPITLFCLVYAWALMFIVRYIKVNGFHKTSFNLFISSIYVYFTAVFIGRILENAGISSEPDYNTFAQLHITNWSTDKIMSENIIALTSLTLLILAIIFGLLALRKDLKKRNTN